jgi:hypothetical protein
MARRPRSRLTDPLTPVDRNLLALLADHTVVQRAILCTFARIGVAWRQLEADRTQAWLTQLEPHPFYKGGQFLFDLLEVEDFMLDGPPPPVVSDSELIAVASRIAAATGIEMPVSAVQASLDALPPLEPGFYLYRDVLLGIVFILITALSD